MSTITFEGANIEKNGVTETEIKEVFESDLSFAEDITPSARGNDRTMIIGWTFAGRVLEVGIEYFEVEDREHVFHAMDAGKNFKREFERRLKS